MKREFLQNLKVGEQPLPKEVIDAIMEENGRDIEGTKAKFPDYEKIKNDLKEAQEKLSGMEGQDAASFRRQAEEWKKKYETAIADHEKAMKDREFSDKLTAAIQKAQGKNAKAITALLDVETLKGSKEQDADIIAALEACQKENAYLFGTDNVHPPYAAGTGTGGGKEAGVDAFRAAAGLK